MSTASEISDLLASRLAGINITNGYQTDIGERVMLGRRRLDESHVPCAILVEGDDTPKSEQRDRVLLEVIFMLEGHSSCDPDNPNVVAHKIISDLKKSIWSTDTTFGNRVKNLRYLGRQIQPREDGQATVAAGIEISLEFTELLSSP
jgi:hypothetical protein